MNATAAVPSSTPHLLKLLGIVFGLAIGVGAVIAGGVLRTPGAELTPSL